MVFTADQSSLWFRVGGGRKLFEKPLDTAQHLDTGLQQVDCHPTAAPDQPLSQRR
jgi:hypothetical protein